MVEYTRYTIKLPVNLVAWSEPQVDGKRPQISVRPGTTVQIRVQKMVSGTVCTVFVRRKGKLWSNTRLVMDGGKVLKNWSSIEMHETVAAKL